MEFHNNCMRFLAGDAMLSCHSFRSRDLAPLSLNVKLDVRLETVDVQGFRAINVPVLKMESLITTISQGNNFCSTNYVFFLLTQPVLTI